MKIIQWIKRLIDEEWEEAKSPFLPTELPNDEMAAVYLRRLKIFGLVILAPHVLGFLIMLALGLISGRCQ